MLRCLSLINNRLIETGLASKGFTTRWVEVTNPSSIETAEIQRYLKTSLRTLNSLQGSSGRGLEEIKDKSMLVLKIPYSAGGDQYQTHNLYIFLGKKEVITYTPDEYPLIQKVMDQEEGEKRMIFRKGTTFILFTIFETLLSEYFEIISQLDDLSNALEKRVIQRQDQAVVQAIFRLKKSITLLHRYLHMNRNIVLSLENNLIQHANPRLIKYFRNQYNDFMELIDLMGAYRDSLSSTLDLYMSMVSNNLNILIKRITALGSLVLVPTLVSGIYGMNFHMMPELGWKYGYFYALSLMVLSVLVLVWYFKKKNYF